MRHIKVNNDRKSVIFNLNKLVFFRSYLSIKQHILFYSNGQAIWHGLTDIRYSKFNRRLNVTGKQQQ